jgi:hypothetical protein
VLANEINDNLRCFWEDQAKIVCKFGGLGPANAGETTWDLYYEPTNSRNENTVVFKVNGENAYLTFTSPAQATLRSDGKEASVNVENTSQATIKGNESECGIIQPNGPCDGGGDVADGFTGTGLNTEAFINGIKEQQEKEEALSQCENNKGIPLQFITCPLLDGINNTIGALIGGDEQQNTARQGLLVDFLKLPPINSGDTGSVLSQVVGNVVNIANIFYILIFIILIFASSIPFLNLGSYTIKKTLPKFIVAVILTQFSIQICGVIVDFFNLLGLVIPNVIFGLITQVTLPAGGGVPGVAAEVGTGIALVVGAGALGGALFFAPVIIIFIAIIALIAALTAVFYIMIRFFLLYVMIIISPLAFAAWVLPGTEKFFKQWWTNFIKLNAMFVTIMGLLSISILLSLIFRSLGSEGGNTVTTLLSGVIPIIGLILVPKTLKWTTQGMNALASGALNAANGIAGKSAKSTVQAGQKRAVASASGRSPQFLGGAYAAAFSGKNPFSKTVAARLRGQAINEERKDVGEQLNGKSDADIEKYASSSMSKMAKSPNNVKNIGGAQAAVERLLKTGNVTGVAAAQRQFVNAARSANMSDGEIADYWNRSVLAENIGEAKSLAPDLVLDASKNMDSIQSATGRSQGGGGVVTNSGDYSSVGAQKIPGLDRTFLESHHSAGRNARDIGLDQNAVETALTNPDFQSLWTDPKQRQIIKDMAAAAGWRTS